MQSRQVSNFKINKMTKAQYSGIVPSQDEVYITTDEADAVLSVNGVLPNAQGNVTLNIPSAVTESTVAGWGFTKNVGTVTSVNGVSPTNGNVAITIPTVNNGMLTITQDGNTLGTFRANQSTNSTIDIPTIDLNGKADVDLTNITDSAKVLMSGMGMPSGKYINLTLGASGSTYTAPADGWVYFSKACNGSNQNAYIGVVGTNFTIGGFSGLNANGYKLIMPIKKDSVFQVQYTLGGVTEIFRFMYAVGSESEAN